VCSGSTTSLYNATPDGTWASSNTAVATVGTTGVVTGVSGGTAIISYITVCGTVMDAITVTPLPYAGTITGGTSVCTGSSILLSDAVGGGSWSSSSDPIAIVSTDGMVTGVTAGNVTISYS